MCFYIVLSLKFQFIECTSNTYRIYKLHRQALKLNFMNFVWRVELIYIRLMFLLTEIYKKYVKFVKCKIILHKIYKGI